MSNLDVLQQAINAAKPVKIVALRARREYRRLSLDARMREAVQIYPSTSFLDLPPTTDEAWDYLTKEQQTAQLVREAELASAFKQIYAEASIK